MIARTRNVALSIACALLAGACGSAAQNQAVVLDDLNEPRGLWILSDGTLCVAEAGTLAEGQTVREGPTANRAETGSVSCIDTEGSRERIIGQLPYVRYNVTDVTTGPADLAEMDGELYLLTGEGEGNLSRSLLRITNQQEPPDVVADFLAYAIVTAEPDLFDNVDIFSNPYAMIPDPESGRFLVTDGATGHVMAVGLDGDIRLFAEVPGHEVLTGIVMGPDELVYVASFSQLPHAAGDGAILRLFPDGTFAIAADDLTTPIDLAFDSTGSLYVLEFVNDEESDHPYRGKSGRLLRLDQRGSGWADGEVLIEGLPFPTALLIDDEDRIYISVHGAFSEAESGLVVRFDDLRERDTADLPIRFVDRTS